MTPRRHAYVANYDVIARDALRILPALCRNPLSAPGLACRICAAPVYPSEEICTTCLGHRHRWGSEVAGLVVPLTYAGPHNLQVRQDLWQYKNSEHLEVRRLAVNRLSYLVWFDLVHHVSCIEALRGPITVVTNVPSGRQVGRTGGHPLDVLTYNPFGYRRVHLVRIRDAPSRVIDPDTLTVTGDVRDAHVLVIDDTWTGGASTQSADRYPARRHPRGHRRHDRPMAEHRVRRDGAVPPRTAVRRAMEPGCLSGHPRCVPLSTRPVGLGARGQMAPREPRTSSRSPRALRDASGPPHSSVK